MEIVFEYTDKGDSDFQSYYINMFAVGSGDLDLIYRSVGNDLWFLAEAKALYPITDFPEFIDLNDSDKYGTAGVLEAGMHNGIPYAVQLTYWPGLQGTECFYIAYNRDMFLSMGLTDLHEYYENQTWTWDTLNFSSILQNL